MRHFLKRRTVSGVEIPNQDHLQPFRMGSLSKKNSPYEISRRESQTRLKNSAIAAIQEIENSKDARHCVAPPAPGDTELDEMFGLEAKLVQLPVLGPVTDPHVLEEAVLFSRSEKLHEVAEDLGLFDEEEPKSSVDSHTIAPGTMRRKLDDIA